MKLVAALVLASSFVSGQQTPREFKPTTNPITDHVRELLPDTAKKIVAAAELMPEDKYDFHPTPAQMTFRQLIAHIVQTNVAICSAIANGPMPELVKIAATESKDTLVGAVRKSFDVCTDAMAKQTDAQLGEEVLMMGRRTGLSRGASVITITSDWADHYSTAAVYLRLNGILPPTATPAK